MPIQKKVKNLRAALRRTGCIPENQSEEFLIELQVALHEEGPVSFSDVNQELERKVVFHPFELSGTRLTIDDMFVDAVHSRLLDHVKDKFPQGLGYNDIIYLWQSNSTMVWFAYSNELPGIAINVGPLKVSSLLPYT